VRRDSEVLYLKKFSSNVKKLRRKLELSQEELAEKVGCHVNHIGRIERGQADLSLSMLYKIANALGISVKELLPF
jgi:transcriptional regulator with XRE-family HTH domain